MHTNEIRDYIERAPRKWVIRDGQLVNHTHVRLKWLSESASDQRINRRAGVPDQWRPWCDPTFKAMVRNQRKRLRRTRS